MNGLIDLFESTVSSWRVWVVWIALAFILGIVLGLVRNVVFPARRLHKELSASIAVLVRIKAESKRPLYSGLAMMMRSVSLNLRVSLNRDSYAARFIMTPHVPMALPQLNP